MEYQSNDQLFQYFQKEIKEASEKRMEELKEEIESIKTVELKKIDDELKDSFNHDLELQVKELKTDHSYEMNKLMSENAKELMNKRQELFVSIFEEVKSKLLKYIKTKDYLAAMTKKVDEINKLFVKDGIVFTVMKNDEVVKDAIARSFKGKYKIETSDQIQIGGFLAACLAKGIELDQTLDTLLEAKKQWFYEKSNLYIKK